MSKAYLNGAQVQQHAGDAGRRSGKGLVSGLPSKPRTLPGLGGIPALPPETPELFTAEDVVQAELAYGVALKTYMRQGMTQLDAQRSAIREVMMLALALAAVNLDVHPGS